MTLDGSKKSFSSALLNLQVSGAISGLQLSLTSRKQKFSGLGLALGVKINYVPKKI